MVWLEVSVQTDGEGAEAVAEVLRPFAYQESVVLEQRGDESSLDPAALEPGVLVKIYIPEDRDTPALRRRIEEILYHLNRLYPIPAPTFRELAEEDWANAWKDHYHPFRVGRRLYIRPSWDTGDEGEPSRPGDITLVLDPGMAFGTGLHPTTQGCLQAIEKLATPGASVLDVGTGSGILAIAAAQLGATSVAAFDVDELAVRATEANAAENGVSDRIQVWQGELDSVRERGIGPTFDLVLANILAPVIVRLLKENGLLGYVAPTGHLVLSGIILEQGPDVVRAIEEAGGRVIETQVLGDWVTFTAGRN
jgi:ribosomal protein L11 methyltransferase